MLCCAEANADIDDRRDGLSPAGPMDDDADHVPLVTPPLTDGNDEAGSQVRTFGCSASPLLLLARHTRPVQKLSLRL